MTEKKITSNGDLENFLSNGNPLYTAQPWHGLTPNSKRTGVKAFSIVVNEFEKMIITEAAKLDGISVSAFIRQGALKRAKNILDIK